MTQNDMSELIRRKDVIKAMGDIHPMDYNKISLLERIQQIPVVDAEPVRHGKWVHVSGYCTPGGDPVWKCSECGKGIHVFGIEHGTYGKDIADGQWVSCPNCGAKMDGEGFDDKQTV